MHRCVHEYTFKSRKMPKKRLFKAFFLEKNYPCTLKTGGMGRINDIAIRYVAKLSGKGVSTVQRVK